MILIANECRLHGNTGETQIPINSLGSRTRKFVSRKLKAAFIVSKVARATRERERDRKTVNIPRREFLTRDLLSLRLSREMRIYSFRALISRTFRARYLFVHPFLSFIFIYFIYIVIYLFSTYIYLSVLPLLCRFHVANFLIMARSFFLSIYKILYSV